jgi:ATP-dependent RNA helicase DeaD
MVGGVWFTLSLGRKHRADPKWLLPMICKAGGVTKRDVGSIKILDHETRFEIAAGAAAAFAERTEGRPLEKGVHIAPAGAPAEARAYGREKPQRYNPAAAEKVESDVVVEAAPARKPKRKDEPRPKPKFTPKYQGNPKDKGKPKYKGKAKPDAGDQARVRPKKP